LTIDLKMRMKNSSRRGGGSHDLESSSKIVPRLKKVPSFF